MATRIQDVQASLTRTDEVAKIQQTQHQTPQAQQQQMGAQLHAEREIKRHQAAETSKKEGGKIRDEDYPSRRRQYVPGTKQQKKKTEAKKPPGSGNRIDLKA